MRRVHPAALIGSHPSADSLRRADELLLLILACQTFVEDLDFIICHDSPRVNGL